MRGLILVLIATFLVVGCGGQTTGTYAPVDVVTAFQTEQINLTESPDVAGVPGWKHFYAYLGGTETDHLIWVYIAHTAADGENLVTQLRHTKLARDAAGHESLKRQGNVIVTGAKLPPVYQARIDAALKLLASSS